MNKILIKKGLLFNPPGDVRKVNILIKGSKITRVCSESLSSLSVDDVIDAQDCIIIPGLINLHTHIARRHLSRERPNSTFREGAPKLTNIPNTHLMLFALRNLWADLKEGITTSRDAGTQNAVSTELRNAVQARIFQAPRLLSVGEAIAITGGHGTHRSIISIEADGVDEVRKKVRKHLKRGVDWIKLMASGGIGGLPDWEDPKMVEFSKKELKVAASEAHKRNVNVMTHAMASKSIKNAAEARIDTIEHGVFMDNEAVELMQEKGCSLVPTLSGIYNVYQREKQAGNKEFANLLFNEVVSPQRDSVSKAIKNGIMVGAGTDSLGHMFQELEMLVDCGMTNAEALAAATSNAAKILGLKDKIGVIEEGRSADILILEEDPRENLSALEWKNIREVIYKGRILSQSFTLNNLI